MRDLDEALEYLLDAEGGWSNHPSDRGGATMYGVTQGTYNSWRKLKNLPKQSVRNISKLEARELYDIMYWRASGCDRLPWPISYIVFDAAVNSGASRSVRWLQAGLGLPQDGRVGPKTLQSAKELVESGNATKLLEILDQRVVFLVKLIRRVPSQQDFLLGWWRRSMKVLARALLAEIEE